MSNGIRARRLHLLYLGAAAMLLSQPLQAHGQIHVPNFQLGMPLQADDSALSELHSDRSPELRVNTLLKQGKIDEGLEELDAQLKEQPNHPVLWLMRAYAHELRGQYAEALVDLEKAQQLYNSSNLADRRIQAHLLLFKGIALTKLGKSQQSLNCLNQAIAIDPDPSAIFARGVVYQSLFKNEQALEDFNQALKANPANAVWLESRAFTYCTVGDFSRALNDCNKAAEVAPVHGVYETMAWAYHGLRQYDNAVEAAQKALAIWPDSVIAFWRSGIAHLAQGKSKEAANDFSKGLAIRRSGLLLRDRALAEVDLREYDKAIADATDAMKELAKEAQPYRIRAMAFYAKGDCKKCIDDLNEAIKLEPDDSYTYVRRGNAFVAHGDWENGLADYLEAEKKNPSMTLHAEKSRAYRHMKKMSEALHECDEAIKKNPHDEAAFEARARVHLAQWQNDSAISDADTASKIAADPKWVGPAEVKALAYSQREQWLKELAECDASIIANPEESAMYVHRAYAMHRLGDFKKAVEDLNKAVELDPSADNYAARADARLYVGDTSGAICDANESIKRDACNSYAYIARGAAYGRNGDKARMRSDFQKGLRLDKEPAYAHATVAEYFMELEMNADAVDEYTIAIAGEPGNAQLYRWRGQALLNSGKIKEAIADFDKAVSLETVYPSAYAFRADAQIRLGNLNEAIADCNKAIALDESCELAYKNRALAYEKLGRLAEAAADREIVVKRTR